jgi:hypothetical protein
MKLLSKGLTTAFALSVAVIGMNSANAANITWQTPQDQTKLDSDIVNTGSLFSAVTAGQTTTVNGVTFVGQTNFSSGTLSFGTQPITVSGITNPLGGLVFEPDRGAAYAALVAGISYGYGTDATAINISGLTIGQAYNLQIFAGRWNNNFATNYTGGANTSADVNLEGDDIGAGQSGTAQYIIGSFTASSATQVITLDSPTHNYMFTAIQLRAEAAVPETATWAMIIVGFGFVGGTLRRRERIAASA